MNSKINILSVALLGMFLSCSNWSANSNKNKTPLLENKSQASYVSEHLIELSKFEALYKDPNYKVIHFGRPEEFTAGHIPGALNIWRNHIEDTTLAYGGIMASKAQIEALFGSLGIENEHTLLVYDAVASCDAARFWWVLKNYGFNNVIILNGGIQAWTTAGKETTQEQTPMVTTSFVLPNAAPMNSYVNHKQLLEALSSDNPPILIDTRTSQEFSGERQKKGALASGRIPKSYSIDWAYCVNFDGDKKFKDFKDLTTLYENLIPDKNQPIITYCHSGVRSAHTTFVLTELLGYKNVKNYDGSWTEWSHLTDYPIIKDSVTRIRN